MQAKTKEYLNKELQLLSEYEMTYSKKSSLYQYKLDKIKGALGLAKHLELITEEEYVFICHNIHNKPL